MALNLGSITFGITANTSGLSAAAQQVGNFGSAFVGAMQRSAAAAQQTKSATDQLSSSMRSFGAAVEVAAGPLNGYAFRLRAATLLVREHGIALGLTIGALAGFGAAGYEVVSQLTTAIEQFQRVNQVINTVTNSTVLGGEEWGFLADTANKAGMKISDLSQPFIRFQTASLAAGQTLSTTNEEFKQIAQIMGTLQMPAAQAQNAIRAFDETLSLGYVQTRVVTRMLANDFPGAMEIAKEATGKTGAVLFDMLNKGQIEAPKFIKAFLDAFVQARNIDLSKNVDTLQASLNRVSNAWLEFRVNLANSIGAATVFKAVADGITAALNFMGNNINGLLAGLSALTGAVAGLLVVIGANGLVSAISAAVTFFGQMQLQFLFLQARAIGASGSITAVNAALATMAAAEAAGTATTAELTASLDGLIAGVSGVNVAMDLNPIGAFLVIVAQIAAVVGGASIAMGLFSQHLADMSVKASDTRGLEAQIDAEFRLGRQIEGVNDQIIKQLDLLTKQNEAAIAADTNEMMGARARATGSASGNLYNLAQGALAYKTIDPNKIVAAQVGEWKAATDKLQSAMDEQKRLQTLVGQAEVASILPTGAGDVPPGTTKPIKTKHKDPKAGLAGLDDLIEKAKAAQNALDNMWRGPQSEILNSALTEASAKLFDVKNQATLIGILMKAGFSPEAFGGLKDALTVVITRTKMAEEAVKSYMQVWNDINKVKTDIAEVSGQIGILVSGGGQHGLWIAEAAKDAQAELDKLNKGGIPELTAALAATNLSATSQKNILDFAQSINGTQMGAVVKMMTDLGYSVSHTGNAAIDAKSDLTAMFASLTQGKDVLEQAKSGLDSLKKSFDELAKQRAQLAVLRAGGGEQALKSAQYGQQASDFLKPLQTAASQYDPTAGSLSNTNKAALDAALALAQYNTQLDKAGILGTTLTQKVGNLYQQMDRNADAIKMQQKALEENTQAWVTWADSGVDALGKVLEGTETWKDAMHNLLLSFADTVIKTSLLNPIKDAFDNTIPQVLQQATTLSNNATEAPSTTGISAIFAAVWQGLQQSFLGGAGGLGQSAAAVAQVTATSANTAALLSLTAVMASSAVVNGLSGLGGALGGGLEAAGSAAAIPEAGLFSQLATAFPFAGGGPTGRFTGLGTGTSDSNFIRISNGEYIVRAAQAQKHAALLDAINSGALSGARAFALGGSTGSNYVPSQGNYVSASDLTNQSSMTHNVNHIDASSPITINGSLDHVTYDQLVATLKSRDASMQAQLPGMIDKRVIQGIQRARY